MSNIIEPSTAELATTLSELRQLLEVSERHRKDMADRFRELSNQVSDLFKGQHQLERSLGMLTQRMDEVRPTRYNCPHCGAGAQREWTHCRMCTKALS